MRRPGVSLFWRTFLLIALLIAVSLGAWFQSLRVFERTPRALQLAWQVASVVNLTRAALVSSQADRRLALLEDLAREEGVRVFVLEPGDSVEPLRRGEFVRTLEDRLRELLGAGTTVAARVNGEPGLWVSFEIDGDAYWLAMDRRRLERQLGPNWLGWAVAAVLLSLAGALLVSRLVNRPLTRLSEAIDALSRGERPAPLPESGPSELAELNRRFNRMSSELAALDADRQLALAGISHDIRTPLARLRMEIEMSGLDDSVQASMSEDVESIDRIVGQFVDFAREHAAAALETVDVGSVIAALARRFELGEVALELRVDCPPQLLWRGRALDLERMLANLLANAAEHARAPGADRVPAELSAWREADQLRLRLRDFGPGLPASQLQRVQRPFARLEQSRSGAAGAGLGLAIVSRLAARYGGRLALSLPTRGGLQADLTLADGSAASEP
ncbi:MAG: HAMP domain-containing protein [Burkholderiales bacterium]|nr:MAG: HAMP domain-containing protein [Burkholderiales bacterium]